MRLIFDEEKYKIRVEDNNGLIIKVFDEVIYRYTMDEDENGNAVEPYSYDHGIPAEDVMGVIWRAAG